MNITLPRFLTGTAKPAPSRAAERYRQYRLLGKHEIAVSPPPSRMDECLAKLAEAAKDRDAKVDVAAEVRAKKLQEAKAAYDAALRDADRENRQTQHKANVEFDELEAKLLAEYARPLSAEEVALLVAKPGETVRVQPNGGGK